MNKYTIVNKAKKPMRIFAATEQRAIDIAIDNRHAYREDNLTISHSMEAPSEYHEGIASKRLATETFNLETLQNEIVDNDTDKLGWYGGEKQQPKVGDPNWD